MKSTIEQFAKLKQQLTEERETLTRRLADINAVLANTNLQAVPENGTGGETLQTPAQAPRATRIGKRSTGKLTLDQAVLEAFGFGGGTEDNGKAIAELLSLVKATAGKTHKVTRPTVGLACYRLKKKGQIKSVGRGMYALA